jgi:hypothetical protein
VLSSRSVVFSHSGGVEQGKCAAEEYHDEHVGSLHCGT